MLYMFKKFFTFDEFKQTLNSKFLNHSKARRVCEYVENIDFVNENNETIIYELIRNHKIDAIKILLEYDILLDIENNDGVTPLVEAIITNQKKIVELLIDNKNLNVNYKNKFKRTAIQEAALNGIYWAVEMLLPKVDDINSKDIYGRSVLFDALAGGNHNILDLLLDDDKLNINIIDYSGKAALFNAVLLSDIDLIEKLIDKNINLDIIDNHGKNVLFYAVTKGIKNATIINLLLEHGLDINVKDNASETILFEIINKLSTLKHADSLIKQKREDLYKLIEMLLDKNLDISACNKHNQTVLFHAVSNKDTESINFLVQHGIDINHKDKKGETAIFEAVLLGYGYKSVIYTLLDNAIDLNIRNFNNKTIIEILVDVILMIENGKVLDDFRLSICTTEGEYFQLLKDIFKHEKSNITIRTTINEELFFEIISSGNNQLKLLFLQNTDINIVDNQGRNLLAKSIESKKIISQQDLEFFKFLIKNGMKVNLTDNKKQTVLHKAVIKGSASLVQFLLDYAKADSSIKDSNGRYPLHLIRGKNSQKILKLLLKDSIRFINSIDNFGYMPINYLAFNADIECVQILIDNDALLINTNLKNKNVTKKLYKHLDSLDRLLDNCDKKYEEQIKELVNNMKNEVYKTLEIS